MWTRINIRGAKRFITFFCARCKNDALSSIFLARKIGTLYKIAREEGKSKVDLVFLFLFISHERRREIIDQMNKTRARRNPVLFQHFSLESRRSEVTADLHYPAHVKQSQFRGHLIVKVVESKWWQTSAEADKAVILERDERRRCENPWKDRSPETERAGKRVGKRLNVCSSNSWVVAERVTAATTNPTPSPRDQAITAISTSEPRPIQQ